MKMRIYVALVEGDYGLWILEDLLAGCVVCLCPPPGEIGRRQGFNCHVKWIDFKASSNVPEPVSVSCLNIIQFELLQHDHSTSLLASLRLSRTGTPSGCIINRPQKRNSLIAKNKTLAELFALPTQERTSSTFQ